MSEQFILLVKLEEGPGVVNNHKLSFKAPPSLSEVQKALVTQAKVGSEWAVALSASDPDFPSETVVLLPGAKLQSKQVLIGKLELREAQSWNEVDCSETSKQLLKNNGITPNVGFALVNILGFTEPEDLQHVTDDLLARLPLKPLEKQRLLKLIETSKEKAASASDGVAMLRMPSARFTAKSLPAADHKQSAASAAATTRPPAGKLTVDSASTKAKAAPASGSKPASTGTASPAPAAATTSSRPAAGAKTTTPTPATSKAGKPSTSATPATTKAAATTPAATEPAEKSESVSVEAKPELPADQGVAKKPPEDEDDDELLARVLAEGNSDSAQGGAASAKTDQSECIAVLEGHKDSVLALALTPDGQTLFTASGDNTIKVWNLKSMTLAQTLTDHGTSVGVLAIDAAGQHLISGSGDGQVCVWEVSAGKASLAFQDTESHAYGILAMRLANTKPLLFTATGDKKIRGFEIHYKKKSLGMAMEMVGHLESVRAMALSPDDAVLYSASEDATIKEWHVDPEVGYKFCRALRGHEAAVYGLDMSKDGKTLVSCSADKTITVWKVTPPAASASAAHKAKPGRESPSEPPALSQVLCAHHGDVNCVALSKDRSLLVSSGDDKTVRVWSLQSAGKQKTPNYSLQSTYQGHALIVYPVIVSEDAQMVVSGSADNSARIWKLHK